MMKYLFYSSLFILSVLSYSCTNKVETTYPNIITDLSSPSTSIHQIDVLRYEQKYEEAAKRYQAILTDKTLTEAAIIYVLNQLTYCKLLINQEEEVGNLLAKTEAKLAALNYPAELIRDFYYNKSRFLLLEFERDSAVYYGHKSLNAARQFYPLGHLKTAQNLTLLSLIHVYDGNLTDSIHYYALQSNDAFLSHPELAPYDWENDYAQAYSSLLNRAHERGAYLCKSALQKMEQKKIANDWLKGRCLNLLAKMLKKQADRLSSIKNEEIHNDKMELYSQADSLFHSAIALSESHTDSIGFYQDWIINRIRFSDSSYFFSALQTFESAFSEHATIFPYYYRLLGYYYRVKQPQKAINFYLKFLNEVEKETDIDYKLLAEAYYILKATYYRQGDFSKAIYYEKKSFLLYGCCDKDWDIYDPQTVNKLNRTQKYCYSGSGNFASILMEKYEQEGHKADLDLANTHFDFIEQNIFNTFLRQDEDAFLTFQFEAGNWIFSKAITAAYEGWLKYKEDSWKMRIFRFMEHTKSYLLYRDMLKKETTTATAHTLMDSIRITQGKVNSLLYQQNNTKKDDSNLFNQNSINQLLSLEQKRSSKIAAFQSKRLQGLSSITSLQKKMAEKQGLLNYSIVGNKCYGLYIDRDTSIVFEHLSKGNALKEQLQTFKQSIASVTRLDMSVYQHYLESATYLYQALIQPIEQQLNQIKQLVIIPDPSFDQIPFEAFLSNYPKEENTKFNTFPYLLKKVEIIYSTSWKVFQYNQSRINSDFSKQSIGFWTTPSLSSSNNLAQIEQAIALGFKHNYTIFNQPTGGKHHFLNQHTKYDVLHLLLHAKSSKVDRYENSIQFGNEEGDLLYGFELYDQQLNAKLLVLASCESAAGSTHRGEGTFSLTRSFQQAGIPQVIAAQYLIPQVTTSILLSKFYQNLSEGMPASTAFHKAKLAYLATNPKQRYAYPHFWAGLILYN